MIFLTIYQTSNTTQVDPNKRSAPSQVHTHNMRIATAQDAWRAQHRRGTEVAGCKQNKKIIAGICVFYLCE